MKLYVLWWADGSNIFKAKYVSIKHKETRIRYSDCSELWKSLLIGSLTYILSFLLECQYIHWIRFTLLETFYINLPFDTSKAIAKNIEAITL
jgi:hypothetical protein